MKCFQQKKKKPDQELFVVKHNRSEEQQNTINYRDLTVSERVMFKYFSFV